MATSKKEPLNPSRDRATRMSPNLRPSSSESSGYGYGVRRARSVPSSPDRKFGSSSPSMTASSSLEVNRPSLSSAGRSQTMSSSGSRAQPFSGAASKPTLARAKSDRVSTSSRPPALAVPPSNSFKDMAKTVSKAMPSTLLRNKLSPRPGADSSNAASPKPSTQRVASPGSARGGRLQPVSTARLPGPAAKNRLDSAKAATASSKAKSVSQKTMGASATRKEKEEDRSMQFKETETMSTPTIEEHLHDQLPDPVDLKSMEMVPDQDEPSSNQSEQHIRNEEKVKAYFFEEKEKGDARGNDGQDANGDVKTVESGLVKEEVSGSMDKAVPLSNRTEVAQVWRKDDPKGNDVIEETKSKLLEERKSRVKALVGAFETVMSFKE